MTGFLFGLLVAGVTVGYLSQRIGAIVTVTIYPPGGGEPIERANMPPTRWALWLATVRRVAGIVLGMLGALVVAGWALGGCS